MKKSLLLFFLISIVWVSCKQSIGSESESTLIINAWIVDGSGNPPYEGSLRFQGNKIIAIGNLKALDGEKTYDAEGLVLAPGFIDTHSHHDSEDASTYIAALSQGITTIVIGQDGFSHYPIKKYFRKLDSIGIPINMASYIGHNTLRALVLAKDFKREATTEEIEKMRSLLRSEMKSGAIGLSTGLEYDPGIYSNQSEVVLLAKELGSFNGRYISHMRSEDVALESSIHEIINIAKQAEVPVQISHFKLARKSLWGKTAQIIAILDSARAAGIDITADVYPYEYWQSTMQVMFPKRDFDNIETARFALTELTDPEGVIISSFKANPVYEGKTLAEIAILRDQTPEASYLDLIKMSLQTPGESIIARSMTNEDILALYHWPHSNVCSDGSAKGHPRGWGSFPRFFDMASSMTLEQRVNKMTLVAAQHMGFKDMGILKENAFADLVLFDPTLLKDHADFINTSAMSSGIKAVWVNGSLAFEDKALTNNRIKARMIVRQ